MSLSRNQLNQYLANIDITGRIVLDVGVQDKPTSRLTHGTPKVYWTLDIDEQWDPGIVGDLNDPELAYKILGQTARAVPGSQSGQIETGFDMVFCIEVLEHCWNPVKALANLSQVMKQGGDLYISTPFINPHHDYVDYLRFTNEWYRDVCPRLGLSVVKITERVATAGRNLIQQFYTAEGLRVSKIRPEYGKYTYPIGYIVHARKGDQT